MSLTRKQLTTMIHTIKTRHGLPEDSYRAQIANSSKGKTSCTDCSLAELNEVLKQLKLNLKRDPRLNKITALWLSAAASGVVRDKSQRAMRAFCKRFCVKPLEQANGAQLNMMISALQAMEKRA